MMDTTGVTLGTLIAQALVPPPLNPLDPVQVANYSAALLSCTATWTKISSIMIGYLQLNGQVITTINPMPAPGPNVALANAGGPATGLVTIPPLFGNIL